jgi:hypothetical protein
MEEDIERDKLRWKKIRMRVAEVSVVKAFNHLRAAGVEPILIKGWAISRLYSGSHFREFIDTDLGVDPLQYQTAKAVLENGEVEVVVDLHKGFRHLDTVCWKDLFENSQTVKIENTDIRILRPEDHLRILCVHWLNDGGENKERLWDIYYAVENRPVDFDWKRCLNTVSKKRRKWIVTTILLAHKHIGLDIKNIPICEEEKQIPQWLNDELKKQWEIKIPIMPMEMAAHNKKQFFEQIKKRFPPNPITATINMEGDFDEKPRMVYQIPDFYFRLLPSLKKFLQKLKKRKINE